MAFLKCVPSLLLLIISYPLWRNSAYPTLYHRQHRLGLRIVNRNFSISFNNVSRSAAREPFEPVARQSFIGRALEQKTVKILILGTLTVLNGLSHFLQFGPGVGRILETVFFQQVCSIIKQPSVSKKGNGDKLAVNSVILDDPGKELTRLARSEILREISRMGRGNGGPNDVDQVNVHIRSLGRPILLP